ncbi:MAG: hypothetical protein HYY37_06860 [Candidatus Aenigmarchaeota archaeon]|nr:hypothetical protein [Candidatus Aenigmarchaeota archaeon]
MPFDKAALAQFREHAPDHYERFPHETYMDAIRALAGADPIEPWFHQEVGLAAYRPADFYLVNGREGISFNLIQAERGKPDATLHTHHVGRDPYFPTRNDIEYFGRGHHFILSRQGGMYFISRYGSTGFDLFDGGRCIWPENESGTGLTISMPPAFLLHAGVDVMPLRTEERVHGRIMRALTGSKKVIFDVLPLELVEQLHIAYGDDVFYGDIDWYTEGKRLQR